MFPKNLVQESSEPTVIAPPTSEAQRESPELEIPINNKDY
jgi:hypothetical protein